MSKSVSLSVLIVVVSGLLAASGLASPAAYAAWDVDPSGLNIPPPPSPGSAADQRDFEVLFRYQQTRTQDDCAAADAQSMPSLAAFFGPQTGVLADSEVAAVDEFSTEVAKTVSKTLTPFKRRWPRQRPYDENSEIQPCIRKPGGQTSYPSLHAALGVVLGDVLAEIFPDKQAELHAAGLKVGENRVLGGVHHPTDVDAGRALGTQLEALLHENPDFVSALESLKRH